MSSSQAWLGDDQDKVSARAHGGGGDPADASAGMWLFACAASVALASVDVSSAIDAGKSGGEVSGAALGALFVPLVVVGLFSISERFRTPRARVRVFGVTAAVLFLLGLAPRLAIPAMFRDVGEPWDHRLEAVGVAVRLPSERWRLAKGLAKGQSHLADFAGAPNMLAAVTSVDGKTLEQFEQAGADLELAVRGQRDLVGSPSFESGETPAGDRFVIGAFRERSTYGTAPIYVAHARVWLKGSQKMVRMIFEGHPMMSSEAFQASEVASMKKAARRVFLSVHE